VQHTIYCNKLQRTKNSQIVHRLYIQRMSVMLSHTATNYNTQHTAKNHCTEFFEVHTTTRILCVVASTHTEQGAIHNTLQQTATRKEILRLYIGSRNKRVCSIITQCNESQHTTYCQKLLHRISQGAQKFFVLSSHHTLREVGSWGRDPQKCTGRDWGMGSSTI